MTIIQIDRAGHKIYIKKYFGIVYKKPYVLLLWELHIRFFITYSAFSALLLRLSCLPYTK